MSHGSINTLKFRSAMFGYSKSDVDSYVERAESELEIQKTRLAKLEQQLGQLRQEADRARSVADEKLEDCSKLTGQNAEFRRTIRDLEEQLAQRNQLNSRVQEENQKLRKQLSDSGADSKTIQDAILNAQRLSGIMLEEAKQESLEIRHQAERDRKAVEDSSRKALEQAQQEAENLVQTAQLKCENLQRDYDQVLMDVTLFKAKLLQMYREHMEKLLALPEMEPMQLECVSDAEVIEETQV